MDAVEQMTSEQEEHVRAICRAWMDFCFPKALFIADKAVKDVPKEIKEQIWDEEFKLRKGA